MGQQACWQEFLAELSLFTKNFYPQWITANNSFSWALYLRSASDSLWLSNTTGCPSCSKTPPVRRIGLYFEKACSHLEEPEPDPPFFALITPTPRHTFLQELGQWRGFLPSMKRERSSFTFIGVCHSFIVSTFFHIHSDSPNDVTQKTWRSLGEWVLLPFNI